jgi:hypothetical protein
MIAEILKNKTMNDNFETGWFPAKLDPISNMGKVGIASSLQISWTDVTGTLDGIIEIYASNDISSKSLGRSINVNSGTNEIDSEMLLFYGNFNYLKIKFIKNGISSGKMTAIIDYV